MQSCLLMLLTMCLVLYFPHFTQYFIYKEIELSPKGLCKSLHYFVRFGFQNIKTDMGNIVPTMDS